VGPLNSEFTMKKQVKLLSSKPRHWFSGGKIGQSVMVMGADNKMHLSQILDSSDISMVKCESEFGVAFRQGRRFVFETEKEFRYKIKP
jgi:hypothetical protein